MNPNIPPEKDLRFKVLEEAIKRDVGGEEFMGTTVVASNDEISVITPVGQLIVTGVITSSPVCDTYYARYKDVVVTGDNFAMKVFKKFSYGASGYDLSCYNAFIKRYRVVLFEAQKVMEIIDNHISDMVKASENK